MSLRNVATSIVAAGLLIATWAIPASAFGWGHGDRDGPDPYAYHYEPRGYYPYYKSDYWKPGYLVRKRRGLQAPRYYPAWGYYNRRYHHRRWHERHHGGHPFWYW
jgi:hypothetical protein